MNLPPAVVRDLATQNGKLTPCVTLPAPPSANHLFATVNGRRVKSREYKAWLAEVVPLLAFLASPASYPCRYHLLLAGRWNVQRDGENALKAVLDASVVATVIPDDSLKYVRGGAWDHEPGADEATVTLSFAPA